MADLRPGDGPRIVQVPTSDLRPDPATPREIGDAEIDALTRSLREFGFVQPAFWPGHDDKLWWPSSDLRAGDLETMPVTWRGWNLGATPSTGVRQLAARASSQMERVRSGLDGGVVARGDRDLVG